MQPILKINLSTQKFEEISIPKDWARAYLGGARSVQLLHLNRFIPITQKYYWLNSCKDDVFAYDRD